MIQEVPRHPATPPCPECGQTLEAVINSKVVIGWRCLICGRAISIERARQ